MSFHAKTLAPAGEAQIIPFPTVTQAARPARLATERMQRPPTLTRAARWRAARYRRGRDLPRLASGLASMSAGSAALLSRLEEIELECWSALRTGAAHYAPERHVLALAALLSERRVVARASGQTPRG